jgi:hypothetical protein
MKGLSGLSFNVTLSDDQMDHIAALAADKVSYTFKRLQNNDMYYDDKIKQLEHQVVKRNELLVGKELFIERLMKIIDEQKLEIEELKSASN